MVAMRKSTGYVGRRRDEGEEGEGEEGEGEEKEVNKTKQNKTKQSNVKGETDMTTFIITLDSYS